jgi:hypothetical protein
VTADCILPTAEFFNNAAPSILVVKNAQTSGKPYIAGVESATGIDAL